MAKQGMTTRERDEAYSIYNDASYQDKTPQVGANMGIVNAKTSFGIKIPESKTRRGRVSKNKTQALVNSPNLYVVTSKRIGGKYGQATRWGVFDDNAKAPTIVSGMGTAGGNVPHIIDENISDESEANNKFELNADMEHLKSHIRKLTPIECERLQTLDDNYTEFGMVKGVKTKISNTQRYKCIGNGWTVDVIAYIFGYLKKGLYVIQ